MRLRWRITPIWNALDADEAPHVLSQDAIYISWIIWRKNFSAQFQSVSEIEPITLNMAMTGATFEEVCESLE